jgi:hypothetical protein
VQRRVGLDSPVRGESTSEMQAYRSYDRGMEELIAWARDLGLRLLPPRDDDLLHVADPHVGYSIAERQGLYAVELSTREHERELLGAFDRVEDARRLVALELGAIVRSRESLPALRDTALARGFTLEHTPIALWLTWDDGSAEFPPDEEGRLRARAFSRVVDASVAEIEVAFRDADGAPLF